MPRTSTSSPPSPWLLWVDTGGTFTDCIARDPDGNTHHLKVLSSSVVRATVTNQPDPLHLEVNVSWPCDQDIFAGFELNVVGTSQRARVTGVNFSANSITLEAPIGKVLPGAFIELSTGEEVPVLAARLLTRTSIKKSFPPLEMKLGSTRGTNAILENKGAKTAFLVTAGFKDLVQIGNQQRPDLFALDIRKPAPLYEVVAEINERIASDGKVLTPLSTSEIDRLIELLRREKIASVAIALLNAYANPAHEHELAMALRNNGFSFVSASHELSSQIRLLTRAETTIANAYLDPIIRSYVDGIQKGLSGAPVFIMTSSGSLVPASSFYPKDSLLSGPAGGVVGAAQQALRSGVKKILAFDMGGTSTDVSLYNGRYDYRFESRVGSHSILSPALAIETIAAGGGSICDFDGYRLLVGPQSAGANPGPACYGAGGPLTITDVNLLLGRIDPRQFAIPLAPEKSKVALSVLLDKMKKRGKGAPAIKVLNALLQIANEKMAEAIRKISVQQGHDPRDFTLLSFGGAGGQHACSLAGMLNIAHILVPYEAGLLSAYGIGHATVERFEELFLLQPLAKTEASLSRKLDKLYAQACQTLITQGHPGNRIRRKANLIFLRFAGQDTPLEISYRPGDSIVKLFKRSYISVYGHYPDRTIEVESIRVIAEVVSSRSTAGKKNPRGYVPRRVAQQRATVAGKQKSIPVFRWEMLRPGALITGPALVVSENSTTLVEQGWKFQLDGVGNGRMKHQQLHRPYTAEATAEGELELFTNRFTAVAQEMGALLQRTSFSVNIKERLDFSCAVLDAAGYLVVNAPHIPVHLGSMGVCVREVKKVIPMQEGDVVITNHPAFGGSHLPDVTLIKPVYHARRLVGYVANRAHHAEIGGSKPGSMPADAAALEQEGVIISPTYLVRRGKPQWEKIAQLLTTGKFPTRALAENVADLRGALASILLGERRLQALCEAHSAKTVSRQMKSLKRYACSLLRDKIIKLNKQSSTAVELLDDGAALKVTIKKNKSTLTLDFTGSSPVHPGNLNATRAIVQSVVLYCLRLWVNAPLPMNEGLLDDVDIVLPHGLLNPDFRSQPMPAVVGGNTEISQRLTDTVLKALGLAACSQGTMNNFLFGNEKFGYYETICGGTGAGEGFHGASAVHQHMTNTRITDPEVLEFRYPVRLLQFAIRTGSGGPGRWRGGDGCVREVQFLEKLEVNLLTQHRVQAPYGMMGAENGRPGKNTWLRTNGTTEDLKGVASFTAAPGDNLIIETPGGGGWG